MRLSDLQKYILLKALEVKDKKFSRENLVEYYDMHHQQTKSEQRIKVITRSLERMIDKELIIGYGTRTPHKWFIKDIKLTARGRKVALKLLDKQQMLPFKVKSKRSKGKSTIQK